MKLKAKQRMDVSAVRPTLLDRAIQWADPVRGLTRLRARFAASLAGGYYGGSRSRRSLSGWTTKGNDPDGDILPDIDVLRERSRDLRRNNPLAAGAFNTMITNVVGSGLKVQSRIDREILAMEDQEAEEWQDNTEAEFSMWAESKESDAARSVPFNQNQGVAFGSALESGDCFALLPFIKRQGSPYGLSVQLIEADRVTNINNGIDTALMSGGIRRNSFGEPIEYYVLDQHPGRIYGVGAATWTTIKAFQPMTGRPNILHLFSPTRPGQTRGVPWLATVIEAFKQIGRYSEAELAAAVVNSYFTVFITSPAGSSAISPVMNDETGAEASDSDLKLVSGGVGYLRPGESIESAESKRPSANFDPFVTAILSQVGAALGIPFELLVKRFMASFSASQAALLEGWRTFTTARQGLASNLCQPVYEAWMWEAVSSGRITAPGFLSDARIRRAYLGSEWLGPARGMIREKDEIEAARSRVDMGITTLAEETARLTGGEWRKKHAQRAKEQKARRDAGLLDDKTSASAPVVATLAEDDE